MSLLSMSETLFAAQKEKALGGVDLSRKGNVDSGILDLIEAINASSDLASLSSCSGRIVLYWEGQ